MIEKIFNPPISGNKSTFYFALDSYIRFNIYYKSLKPVYLVDLFSTFHLLKYLESIAFNVFYLAWNRSVFSHLHKFLRIDNSLEETSLKKTLLHTSLPGIMYWLTSSPMFLLIFNQFLCKFASIMPSWSISFFLFWII